MTKDCTPCSDTISDCDRCEVEDGTVICTQCSGSLNPTWNHLACTTCEIDQYEDAGGACVGCTDQLANCGRCSVVDNVWQCDSCYGSVEFRKDSSDNDVCECSFVQVLQETTVGDPETLQCTTCSSVLDNCNTCEDSSGTLTCLTCTSPYFMNSNDECVEEACATFDANFQCTECNTRDNLVYKTQ